MKVGIVGLGLIGGSFAKAYQAAGHTVYACDLEESIIDFAMLQGVVAQPLAAETLAACDLLLLCVYPGAAIAYLRAHAAMIPANVLVIDCCGTKRSVCAAGFALAREFGFTYAGGHPMAGKHHSGYKHAGADLFAGAPMVIVPPRYDDIALFERIKEALEPAGFGQIAMTDAHSHDRLIAFTSQLAHVVSNAYVKSPTARDHRGFSAGSYRDLTRVAQLNPGMWTELFMENTDFLCQEIDGLIAHLTAYRAALETGDSKALHRLLQEGSDRKAAIDQ